jgi:hypothetical protein
MSLSTLTSKIVQDEQGLTLIEMLIAVVSGVVVMMALFAILDFSINQSGRIAEKVDADQQGRIALEKVSLELHSSCIAALVTPVQPESDATGIRFISVPGAQAYEATAELHYIHLAGNELFDDAYKSVGGEAPNWKFPAIGSEPSSRQVLLSDVSQSTTGEAHTLVPVFQYFRYYTPADKEAQLGEIDPTAMPAPLNEEHAQSTAEVTVSFTADPTSGRTETDRSADFSDSVLLRFNPTSATSNNAACS